MEQRNGGITEQRKMTTNPKRQNRGMAEPWKSPEILKDGMTENHPISKEELGKVKKGTSL